MNRANTFGGSQLNRVKGNKAALSLLPILIFIGCIGNGGLSQGSEGSASLFQPNTASRVSASISAETGGYVNVGSAQLKIPSQALDSDSTITAEVVDIQLPSGGPRAIGKAIRLKPEGLQFLKPAELEICYSGAEAAALVENGAQIYYHTDDNHYVAIAGSVDTARHCVKSHIEHFSSYVAAAVAQVPGNTAPNIGGANFLPTTPLAGIPLRVRTTINDVNGGSVPGIVAVAFLNYRTVGASSYTRVPLQADTTDDTVTNRYYYLIPASEVTTAGIEYFFEATDNLNSKRTTTAVTRTVPNSASALRFNPTGTLQISAGFNRALTLQATDGTTWQNISADSTGVTNSALGSLLRMGPSTVRFSALGAGSGQVTGMAGTLSASINVNVVPGLLTHIELTDVNQVILTGTLELPAGYVYDFDAIGFDSFGNVATILPSFSASGGIGNITVNLTGAHLTAGPAGSTGSLVVDLGGLTDSLGISVYQAPEVTATAPFDNTTGIALDSTIGVSFSHIMDTSTLTTTTSSACVGSLQVSSDNFVTCVAMASSTPAFQASNTLAILTPAGSLAGLTTYKIRVTNLARNTAGYPLAATYTTPTGFTTVEAPLPPVTLSLTNSVFSENNGSTTVTAYLSQAYASPVTVTLAFSGSAQPGDYTASATTIIIPAGQLSGDITLTGIDNALFDGNRTVVVDIASVVNGIEAGAQQVTADIQDDETAPYVIAGTPLDGSTGNPVNTVITLSFSQPMNPATLTLSTTTACTGAIQVSTQAANFSTCIAMNAALAVMSNGNTTATLTPAAALANSTTYLVRITAAAQGANGAPLANPITSPNGFTTEAAAVTDRFNGEIGDSQFGSCIDADNNYLMIRSVAAHTIYKRVSGIWTQVFRIPSPDASNASNPRACAISGDYLAFIAGATQSAVHVYKNVGSDNYSQTETLSFVNPANGFNANLNAVDLSGDRIIVASRSYNGNIGIAMLYERAPASESWQLIQQMPSQAVPGPSAGFAYDVAINGLVAAISPTDDGAVEIYERDVNGVWQFTGTFGSSYPGVDFLDISDTGVIFGGVPNGTSGPFGPPVSGYVWVVEKDLNGSWHITNTLVGSDSQSLDQFGSALAAQGDTLVIGARAEDTDGLESYDDPVAGRGGIYVFKKAVSGVWQQMSKIEQSVGIPGDSNGRQADYLGSAVGIADTSVFGGAPYTINNFGLPNAAQTGTVWIYPAP